LQREVEQATTATKQLQFSSEQYKDKLKAVDTERTADAEKIRALEKDNRQLKVKLDRDAENSTR
jgi:FtsZ-binding cell division protein ZapB